MAQPVLQARNLVKTYGRVVALEGANLELYPGEVLRYLLRSAHYRQPLDWSDKELEDNFSEEEPEISSETDTEPASANVKPGTAGLK